MSKALSGQIRDIIDFNKKVTSVLGFMHTIDFLEALYRGESRVILFNSYLENSMKKLKAKVESELLLKAEILTTNSEGPTTYQLMIYLT